MRRIAIIGNAGSGKSFLARRLAACHGIPTLDLDHLFWLRPGDYTTKRPADELGALVDAERRKQAWIVEGVYGELVEPFLASAEQLIWLDLPWSVCHTRIRARQMARGVPTKHEAFQALVAYAAAYWEREDGRSHAGHHRLFDAFVGDKLCFTSEDTVNAYVDAKTRS